MLKEKIINDPVFGFITIRKGLLMQLVCHPFMQRLTRIKQLGLTYYVYPGAQHTRFQHALGAMYLMNEALKNLILKGHAISEVELESALAAILLHDLGHAPFSHTLERSLIKNGSHETITHQLIQNLNVELNGKLDLALAMLGNTYSRPFFYELISSQLDVDRMDYLRRDSTFCGVTEGTIGSDRILNMIDIHEGHIVLEEKALFSVEKFLLARRLMYWQVYLHKTAMVADEVLSLIIRRAKQIASKANLFGTPAFLYFIMNDIELTDLSLDSEALKQFTLLDDNDVMASIKVWCAHTDPVLSTLCRSLIERKLPTVSMIEAPNQFELEALRLSLSQELCMPIDFMDYFVFEKQVSDHLYSTRQSSILFKMKTGQVVDVTKISTIITPNMLENQTTKTYLCRLKTELFI